MRIHATNAVLTVESDMIVCWSLGTNQTYVQLELTLVPTIRSNVSNIILLGQKLMGSIS